MEFAPGYAWVGVENLQWQPARVSNGTGESDCSIHFPDHLDNENRHDDDADSSDPFDVPHTKNAPLEILKRWRRGHAAQPGVLDPYLVGSHAVSTMIARSNRAVKASRYLA
ncbi:calcium-transporting ATPase 9, plasma membrane-type-like protein [Corchorus capsularis]|uniref:Calcium-transporting ATPase 9, plasma membrane-type-like protein n=1 Tax=Corchorus capsularis TaxID=210143 RepID=A0A1R3HMN7_COCAP|nr:calcium-transporting ATPase 9, plasma membrane-type-like protein [Corchorus capsularis]